MVEILILRSLAHYAQGDKPAAMISLQQALTLAAPQGIVRPFVIEGSPMTDLLSEAAVQGIMPTYVGKLLRTFPSEPQTPTEKPHQLPDPSQVEPLSAREFEVIQLIAQGLSNREISERLFVALSTVKGHNRKIFEKLHVQRRTEAVARARDLGLL